MTRACLIRLTLKSLLVVSAGCSTVPAIDTNALSSKPAVELVKPSASSSVQPVKFETSNKVEEAPTPRKEPEPFPAGAELSVNLLVEQVLARNPSLAQMVAAWQAASARYPQAVSLEDPMFTGWLAPPSLGSNSVEPGYSVEVSQKFPWCGKRQLRGAAAHAEAGAALHDVDDMRLQLIESATVAFYDFYLVERALAVNEENRRLLKEFRQNAETRYQTGQVPQQDLLQADVEIGRQQERQVLLERMRKVTIARLNTLMHRPPDASIPPPPAKISLETEVIDVQLLRKQAQAQRPDLRALADRIAADEAALALANKEYAPDIEAMAAYNTLMGNGPTRDLAPQLGVRMNLPVRLAKRHAAVAEAAARLAQRRAELDRQIDQINFQVQEVFEQVRESETAVRLYEKSIVPAAEANVKAAQSAYVNGKTPFLSLIEAQRNLIGLRDRYYETMADYHRRKANLDRVVGGNVPAPVGTPSLP